VPLHDIIRERGHRRNVELLQRSVSRDTLPPSLIFAGPPGVGKRATAVALAQALNCLDPENDTDGSCRQCARIARGVHPDVLIVEPGDNGSIKVEQVREAVDRTAFRPFEGRRRVVIIDEADALVSAAQNALLKTLEEPPSSAVFVLVTSRPDMLLPTVLSRCVRLTFAGGSASNVDDDDRSVAQRVLMHAASGTDAKRLDGAKELLTGTGAGGAADRAIVTAHLRAMSAVLRDVLATSVHADGVEPDPSLQRLVPTYQGERGVNAFDAIRRALTAVDRNAGVKVVADWLVLQL